MAAGAAGRAWLWAILSVALAIRVAVVLVGPYEPAFDSADYVRHALSIAAGNGFPDSVFAAAGGPSAFRPPLYPYLLGGAAALTGDAVTTGRILGAVLGSVAVWLVYLVAARLWDRRTALVAAGLAAIWPPLFLLNAAVVTEPLFLCLMLAAVLLTLRTRADRDLRAAGLAGVCCGLAALTRSNGLLLVAPIALGLLPAYAGGRRWLAPAVVVVTAALTVLPWTIRNYAVFGELVPVAAQSGFALAGTYNPDAVDQDGYRATWTLPELTARDRPLYERPDLDEVDLDRELGRRALDFALAHPGYVVETTALNALRTFELAPALPASEAANREQLGFDSPLVAAIERWTFYALALAALASLALLARTRRVPLFVWAVPLLLLAAALPILGSSRYRAPVYPFVVLAAAPLVARLLPGPDGGRP